MTHVVDDVPSVAAEGEEFFPLIGCDVYSDGLYRCKYDRGSDESDPVIIDERERGGSEAQEDARGKTEGEEKGGKCCLGIEQTL